MGPGMETLKDLGSRLKQVSGGDEANVHLLQRFSIAIQRGNCGSVLGSTGALLMESRILFTILLFTPKEMK